MAALLSRPFPAPPPHPTLFFHKQRETKKQDGLIDTVKLIDTSHTAAGVSWHSPSEGGLHDLAACTHQREARTPPPPAHPHTHHPFSPTPTLLREIYARSTRDLREIYAEA